MENKIKMSHAKHTGVTEIQGDTPTMRLLGLLELIASRDQLLSLQDLVEETTLPKPTLHRMLQQLEASGMLQRDTDGPAAMGSERPGRRPATRRPRPVRGR